MASTKKEAPSPQTHRVGEHWSGANPVPTVQKFIEHLDNEKKERDQRIDQDKKLRDELARQQKNATKGQQPESQKPQEGKEEEDGDVEAHKAREVPWHKIHTVTDPTTGRDIGVEDQDETSMEAVKNPMVRLTPIIIRFADC